MSTEDYKALALELVEQVRDTDWGGDDLPFLFGELSKQGVSWVQNIALQELEIENTDPNIGFVSSAGLISEEDSGIHFTGASLNEFGSRYADVLTDLLSGEVAEDNTAPTVRPNTDAPTQITIAEGDELRIDLSDYFIDAEGDDLYYYSFVDQRNSYFHNTDQDTNELILTPDYDLAGDYTLSVYANDFNLDGEAFEIDVTITEATPLVTIFSNRNFDTELRGYRDFETGLADLDRNRGLEILDQAALDPDEDYTISVSVQHIKGDADIRGNFVLAETAEQAYFYGEGRFNVAGGAEDNYIWGSDGINDLRGNDGADRLYGGDGDDRILGNRGSNDQVYGGAGVDTFIFARGDEGLYVRDFESSDTVQLNGFGFDNLNDLLDNALVRNSTGRVIIDIGDDRLQLSDVTIDTLSEVDFIFV